LKRLRVTSNQSVSHKTRSSHSHQHNTTLHRGTGRRETRRKEVHHDIGATMVVQAHHANSFAAVCAAALESVAIANRSSWLTMTRLVAADGSSPFLQLLPSLSPSPISPTSRLANSRPDGL